MGWLARLVGKEAPSLPPGARAFAFDESHVGTKWSIRYAMPGQDEGPDCPRVKAPTFVHQINAYAYSDWVNGDAPSFTYPPGEA